MIKLLSEIVSFTDASQVGTRRDAYFSRVRKFRIRISLCMTRTSNRRMTRVISARILNCVTMCRYSRREMYNSQFRCSLICILPAPIDRARTFNLYNADLQRACVSH